MAKSSYFDYKRKEIKYGVFLIPRVGHQSSVPAKIMQHIGLCGASGLQSVTCHSFNSVCCVVVPNYEFSIHYDVKPG